MIAFLFSITTPLTHCHYLLYDGDYLGSYCQILSSLKMMWFTKISFQDLKWQYKVNNLKKTYLLLSFS